MKKLKPKHYDFCTIKGLTPEQISQHYKLYVGYVNTINKIDNFSKNYKCYPGPNPTYSPMRCLKLGESYSFDGVKLHELYFENITNSNCYISDNLKKLICSQWCSFNNFLGYLKSVCLSMRGWAIVTYDCLTCSLRITGSDLHDEGGLWCACPILVIDVYEHAYFMDFGTDRSKYVDVIFDNLNWKVISLRLAQCCCC
ncbi:superoxide dismutase [Hathewaya limosa]|uniref:superoxide dismutase n=1 Tax=Hathewaya limosa TaxID=1536 RepID=A0ABU0JN22_HATLI|nr:Fe-Mn family superoxide dismutase [Hathewaya limosa]MDQ0478454.1 Fe-Mn family superoxide dismutase [Hathewaya limosa]